MGKNVLSLKIKNWKSKVVKEKTPLRLLNPAEDEDKLSFTRIGDGIRFGIYKLIPASNTGEPAFHLELPLNYDSTLDDYTLSVPVKEKVLSANTCWCLKKAPQYILMPTISRYGVCLKNALSIGWQVYQRL